MKIRDFRIFGIAVFDLVASFIGMIIIFLLARWKHFPNLNIWPFILYAILLAIPIGIFFHVIFGTNTTLNYRLGLSNIPKT